MMRSNESSPCSSWPMTIVKKHLTTIITRLDGHKIEEMHGKSMYFLAVLGTDDEQTHGQGVILYETQPPPSKNKGRRLLPASLISF
jgi:hypothetical protein